MTQHTTSEAVQYWYDAAVERREERDRLRAVVARIRQMADAWEQRLPEVIRTPAVVSAIRAALEPASSAGRAPAADRDAAPTDWIDGHPQLEAIAAAVWEQCQTEGTMSLIVDDPRNIAVAALAAVLPAPTDRAAWDVADMTTRIAAKRREPSFRRAEAAINPPTGRAAVRAQAFTEAADFLRGLHRTGTAISAQEIEAELRRLAGEAQQPGEPQWICKCPAELCRCGHHSEAQQDPTQDGCTCDHPADEHSVYGCEDDCACEWMPKRKPVPAKLPPMDPVHILGIGAEPATAEQDAPPREPHPTQADMDAALTILASVQGQDDDQPAADGAQQQPKEA